VIEVPGFELPIWATWTAVTIAYLLVGVIVAKIVCIILDVKRGDKDFMPAYCIVAVWPFLATILMVFIPIVLACMCLERICKGE